MPTILNRAKRHLDGQINTAEAQQELRNLEQCGVPWRERVGIAASRLGEFFVANARNVLDETGERLNAAHVCHSILSEEWMDRLAADPALAKKVAALRHHTRIASLLVANIQSQEISRELQNVLSAKGLFSDLGLAKTHGSIYPDLYFREFDYSALPVSSRAKGQKRIEGPNLRKNGMPSNVPDGCELKTNEGTAVHVDAHAPHPGLHVAVTWSLGGDGRVVMNDMWIAYLRRCDYSNGNRNVEATTVKYSFGHSPFFSLTRG